MVIDQDVALFESGCQILTNYPSLALQLEEGLTVAQSPEAMRAIEAYAAGRTSLEFCLSVPVTNGLQGLRFATNVAS
ncbi:hypothetical protein Q6280_28705, partial [Klebsiella pneumoniae]|uniref:hypothetical protein n=1 Tax=Klebsiella pneumoniae TaxID=573 RepID=UPI0027315D41